MTPSIIKPFICHCLKSTATPLSLFCIGSGAFICIACMGGMV